MINKFRNAGARSANLIYVAETERDAERLRGQVDAPVRVRERRLRVTIDPATIEEIGSGGDETPRTPEAPGTPTAGRRPTL